MDLREYEQHKFAIAEVLRDASRAIPEVQRKRRQCLQDSFARLADDHFNLVVVGRFSRGKSSLMNAILGSDRLPTGIAPLTSVITTVTYGSKEQVVLKYKKSSLDQEIPIKSLPQYITQEGNPGNVKGIKTAEVQLPSEILRRGFYFVDTPGLGSVIAENTLTTEGFLPEADAFILVTSYDSPLSEEEMRFFRAGSSSGRRIFVVLNKQDLVPSEQREAIVGFVDQQLRSIFGRSPPRILSISSTEAQVARHSGDASRLAASGVPELETQLIRFLLTEKRTEFLLNMCDRVRGLLGELPTSSEVTRLRSRVDQLSERLRTEGDLAATNSVRDIHSEFSNLHRAQPCEVCGHISNVVWDFICQYQYKVSVEHDEQDRFAMRGGFCPFHTWEYHSAASSYGVSNAYPNLLDRLSEELRGLASRSIPQEMLVAGLLNALPTGRDCILCAIREKAEREGVIATARHLDGGGNDALSTCSAICLPHTAMLASVMQNDHARRSLIEHAAAFLQRLSEDMRRFTLKQDAVRRYMTSREETAAAEQGLMAVVGVPRINFMPRMRGTPRCEEIAKTGVAGPMRQR
jgi:small GTP-binding protein